MDNLPTIRTAPVRRRYSHAPSRYVRRKRGPSLGAILFYWLTSAAAGITIGYLIIFYALGQDPAEIGENLPSVSVEWPQRTGR